MSFKAHLQPHLLLDPSHTCSQHNKEFPSALPCGLVWSFSNTCSLLESIRHYLSYLIFKKISLLISGCAASSCCMGSSLVAASGGCSVVDFWLCCVVLLRGLFSSCGERGLLCSCSAWASCISFSLGWFWSLPLLYDVVNLHPWFFRRFVYQIYCLESLHHLHCRIIWDLI